MNANLPPIRVFVRGHFVAKECFNEYFKGHLISVRAIQGQALQFSVLFDDGALYTGLPIHAIKFEKSPSLNKLSDCQPWDAISSDIEVIVFNSLRYMPVEVVPLKMKGKYLFTIDFNGMMDYSINAEQWKQQHCLALDSGDIVIYPQYNLRFLDKGLCSEEMTRQYIHNETTWLSE